MYAFLMVLYVLCSLFLIMVVLLQQGKGAGMGAAFGGASNALFGGRGQTTPLQKLTTLSAVLFMSLSIGLAVFSSGASSDLTDDPLPPGQEEGLMPEQPAAGDLGMTPAEAPAPAENP
jgi:preprotein translocase subunit SecG